MGDGEKEWTVIAQKSTLPHRSERRKLTKKRIFNSNSVIPKPAERQTHEDANAIQTQITEHC